MPAHRTARHTPYKVPAVSSGAWLETHQGGTFRRGDIRPSDDAIYPATDAVQAAIAAEWNGEIGTLRDIGQRFTSPTTGENYPSWRMRDIAEVMGVDTRNRGAVGAAIERAGPLDSTVGYHPSQRQRPRRRRTEPAQQTESEPSMPEPAPVTPAKKPTYPTRDTACAGCGVTFTSTHYGSSGWTLYHSRECGIEHRRRVKREASSVAATPATPTATETPAPTPPPTPPVDHVPQRQIGAQVTWDGSSFRPLIGQIGGLPLDMPGYDPGRQLRQGGLHQAVDMLPESGAWTARERSRWLEMVVGIVDGTITVSDDDVYERWRVAP